MPNKKEEIRDPHGDLGYSTAGRPYEDNGVRFRRADQRAARRELGKDDSPIGHTSPRENLSPGPGVLDVVANSDAARRAGEERASGDPLTGPDGNELPRGPQSDIAHPDHRESASQSPGGEETDSGPKQPTLLD